MPADGDRRKEVMATKLGDVDFQWAAPHPLRGPGASMSLARL
jgi:hypothetical protein